MYNNDNFSDRIQMLEFFVQMLTLFWAMGDCQNNDLMAELQHQNREYLEKILENQKEILNKLAELG